ncbi:hypothetical protein EH223_04130 [candidate division KSB1 bacterium]|nr:hypothetical protein [candidate division KSB1 bacterium]RQW05671.1 MAG: hypothetical protein EH223_04130 [candidate division KSB1 bacterium]
MSKLHKALILFLVFGLVVVATGYKIGHAAKRAADGDLSLAKPLAKDYQQFDGNTIACWMGNDGQIVTQVVTGGSGMEWPKGSNKTIDYASGIWLCGKDPSGSIRTACAEYSSEFQPGPLGSDPKDTKYRIYKISSTDNREEGEGDWEEWPYDLGAPTLKAADGSDSLDADGKKIPGLIGDQTMFWVMNDGQAAAHANVFSTSPMNVEVKVTVFGFNKADPLGNIMFMRFEFENKGNISFDSCYVALWDDPDLGDAADDLVGCDTTLSLGYCYNGGPVDATYGTTPPAIGMDFFQGPEVPVGSGNYLPMTSFVYYWNGAPDPFGDPEDAPQMFNFMKGFTSDGTSYTDAEGQPTKFVFAGDPVTGSGHLDDHADDRRFLMSSGPFTLNPGDRQVVVGAKIIAPGTDNKSSVTALRFFDSFAQNAFDNDFVLPQPPAPSVTATQESGKIVLTWQDDNDKYKDIEQYSFSGYEFEGYNVYQGESESGPWKLIATYDIVNDYGIVFDNTFDVATGLVLEKPVAFGSNSGMNRNITIDMDNITGLALYNYKQYYFSVNSYAVNPDVSPKVAESGYNAVTVMPHSAPLGIKANAAVDELLQGDHTAGISDGDAFAMVVDPLKLTGANYKVSFDTLGGEYVWSVTNTTTNEMVVKNNSNQSGDEDYPIVEGLKFYVTGPPLQAKSYAAQGTRWITGVNWGGAVFFGGADIGLNFFGSTLAPPELIPVELRFAADTTSGPADGWQMEGAVYNRAAGYAYQGIGKLPFTAWDISDPDNPRQLNVCFVEDERSGNANLRWDMGGYNAADNCYGDCLSGDGGREYIFIMDSDYNGGVDYNAENDGTGADVQMAIWPNQRGDHPWLEAEFQMQLYPNYINNENDVFEIATNAADVSAAVAGAQLDNINVVPNPYWAWSPNEKEPTTRIIRFTNMPERGATIRIFDLAGNLVRVIDDAAREAQGSLGTASAQWDARNASDVPVASGMYLVHVEVDGVGEKVLKLAIVNRDERLIYY